MRLCTILALVFAASALLLTFAGTLAVSRFVAGRIQIRAEARMADLAEHLGQIIDANIAERLGDMAVLSSVAQTTATTPGARRAWVDAMRQTYPAYAWIGFTDSSGRVVASTGGSLEGESVAARPWFRAGLDHAAVVDVHEATLPALHNGEIKRFVDVAAPLRDESGATVGVVGGHLSVRWMREISRAAIASALARDPSVSAMILASDGTVVLGPGEQDGGHVTGDLPAVAPLNAGAERATGRGVWPDGREYFTGASRTHGTEQRPRLSWTIVVRQPVEIAQAISSPIIHNLMFGGAAFALLFALLGWWAAERLADPLRALARAASAIGQAPDAIHLPQPRGYVEITELTDAWTGLLSRLSERDCALEQANADLERRVSERTAELAEACGRAEAAQALAEAGERAKSDFLATMSHEIRTPLNAIVGFGDVLARDTSLTSDQRRYVDQMHVGCEVLTTVVNDILDFARIEAGGFAMEAVPFTPRAFVEETAALVRGIAERKGLDLRIVCETEDRRVVGDVTRLRQVLLNLVNNAVKFTPHGSITVTLAETVIQDGVTLRIAVRDTGIGISPEAQARLFNRFVQADSSTTRQFGGTGLGLSIAKGLIEAMDGGIGLDSREGEGATFWFTVTLPVAETHGRSPDTPAPAGSDAASSAHLLLVEDGAINRELAQMVLEAMGYHVDIARDGQEAVTRVQAHAYDLVLMDVEMPVMDGITATRLIRTLEGAARDVPIIAMTAHVLPEQIAKFRAAGANDHVGKPFDRAHLRTVIERCLAEASACKSRAA